MVTKRTIFTCIACGNCLDYTVETDTWHCYVCGVSWKGKDEKHEEVEV